MTFFYFAVGASLAGLTNIESTIDTPPHTLEDGWIPLLGPIARRTIGQTVQHNGAIDVPLRWDVLTHAEFNTLIAALFGNYLTGYAQLYASWMDETAAGNPYNYSPFTVTLERPYPGSHYNVHDSGNIRNLAIPGYDWSLVSTTYASSDTAAVTDGLIYGDTSGGDVTMTLPAASGWPVNVVWPFVKTSASNSLILDADGAATIDGSVTKTLTGLNERANLVRSGASNWVSLS